MGRIITGLILFSGWFLLLFKGSYPMFSVVIIACGVVALHEFLRMSMQKEQTGYILPVLAVGLLPFLGVFLASSGFTSGTTKGTSVSILK